MSAPGTLNLAGIRARAEAAERDRAMPWTRETTLALVDEVERLTLELSRARYTATHEAEMAQEFRASHEETGRRLGDTIDKILTRAEAAEAEAVKLRARVAELEGAEEAAESAADEELGQAAADKAVMSLEAMAFNWIATTDIHKAIAAASWFAGPHAGKLGSCIHGLVSQAWIEGACTGFDARRKLTVAAREQIAEFEQMLDMVRQADRRGVDMWREANPGNEMVLPDRGDLVAWLVGRFAELEEHQKAVITLLHSDEVFIGTHHVNFPHPEDGYWPVLCAHASSYGADAEEIPADQVVRLAALVQKHGRGAVEGWVCFTRRTEKPDKGDLDAGGRAALAELRAETRGGEGV